MSTGRFVLRGEKHSYWQQVSLQAPRPAGVALLLFWGSYQLVQAEPLLLHVKETPLGVHPCAQSCDQTCLDTWAKGLVCSSCPEHASLDEWCVRVRAPDWIQAQPGSCPRKRGCSGHRRSSTAHFAELWVPGTSPEVSHLNTIAMARGRGAGRELRQSHTWKTTGMGLRQWMWSQCVLTVKGTSFLPSFPLYFHFLSIWILLLLLYAQIWLWYNCSGEAHNSSFTKLFVNRS